jgi:zinc transporter
MSDEDGLICAFLLDGEGGGRSLAWQDIDAWREGDGLIWVHLDRIGSATERWLNEKSGVDPVIAEALMVEDVRPRVVREDDALLVTLRGVNLNPDAEPEDMVGIRMWLTESRIITVRHRKLLTVADLRQSIGAGRGPRSTAEFLVRITDGLIARMSPAVTTLDDRVDELEAEVLTAQSSALRASLADVRKTAILLRRYLAPQRDAMTRLQIERVDWLDDGAVARLREVADRLTRYVEDLDAARERAAVTQEELSSRIADQMNRTMYVLTVVAAILLPPSLIVGLFGINVGGMPGMEHQWAFYEVLGLLVAIGVLEYVVLRKLKWI